MSNWNSHRSFDLSLSATPAQRAFDQDMRTQTFMNRARRVLFLFPVKPSSVTEYDSDELGYLIAQMARDRKVTGLRTVEGIKVAAVVKEDGVEQDGKDGDGKGEVQQLSDGLEGAVVGMNVRG